MSNRLFKPLLESMLQGTGVRLDGDRPWDIRVNRDRLYRRALRGSLGIGESYLDGDWDCDALDEMFRVLKPGGRVVICEFSKPPLAFMRAGYSAYLRWVMPAVVAVTSSNARAYDYLAESIADWPDQATLSAWIRGAGFSRVAHRNLTGGVVALHRGRKPEDAAIIASVERRRAARRETEADQA